MFSIDANKLMLQSITALLSLLVALMIWVVVTTNEAQIEIARLHVMMVEVNLNVQQLHDRFDRRLSQVEHRLLAVEKNN